jgi:hypothetical protein
MQAGSLPKKLVLINFVNNKISIMRKKETLKFGYWDNVEIKELLNFSDSTLRRYRNAKVIPFTRMGSKYLYPKKEIQMILDKGIIMPNDVSKGKLDP